MAKKFLCVPPLLPPGSHRVVLHSVEESKSRLYPGQLMLVFTFSCERGIASRVTGTTLRFGDALHATMSQLAGKEIGAWESVCPEDFIGRQYEIDVVAKGEHGIHIESIRPVADE
jgi:hypothetical protein